MKEASARVHRKSNGLEILMNASSRRAHQLLSVPVYAWRKRQIQINILKHFDGAPGSAGYLNLLYALFVLLQQ